MTTSIPTIFIIDDQESVRYALGEMLNVFGFAVETYESADAFLSMLDRLGVPVPERIGDSTEHLANL